MIFNEVFLLPPLMKFVIKKIPKLIKPTQKIIIKIIDQNDPYPCIICIYNTFSYYRFAFIIASIHQESLHFIELQDRKSTRLNSSHVAISYAVFCLKKKK